MRPPLVIAHRGDSSRALENSIEAVRLALSARADMIEIDVRKSRDDMLFVMHDRDTGRTCDRSIDIERATAVEIAQVRLRNGENIPTLRDMLSLVAGKAGLNIEIKSRGAGKLIAVRIAESAYEGEIMLSSFKEKEVADVRGMMPYVPVSVIFDDFTVRDVDEYKAKGYRNVSLRKKTVTRELVNLCHKKEIAVYAWTVDDEEEMEKFISWGVDGIYSNKPAILRKAVERRG